MPSPAQFDRIAEALVPPAGSPMPRRMFTRCPRRRFRRAPAPNGNGRPAKSSVSTSTFPFAITRAVFAFTPSTWGTTMATQGVRRGPQKGTRMGRAGNAARAALRGRRHADRTAGGPLDEVLAVVFQRMSPGSGVHTVESSPESLTPDHIRVLRDRGVGRVSLGIQEFERPGARPGSPPTQGRRRPGRVRPASVTSGLTVNVDLIYGLPEQSEASFKQDFATLAGRRRTFHHHLQPAHQRTHTGRQGDQGGRAS